METRNNVAAPHAVWTVATIIVSRRKWLLWMEAVTEVLHARSKVEAES